jgi:hypothetical protein
MSATEEGNNIKRQKRTYLEVHLFMDDIDCSLLCLLGPRLCPFEIRFQHLLKSDERTRATSADQVSLEGRMINYKDS